LQFPLKQKSFLLQIVSTYAKQYFKGIVTPARFFGAVKLGCKVPVTHPLFTPQAVGILEQYSAHVPTPSVPLS
jgi:hypothetical protein